MKSWSRTRTTAIVSTVVSALALTGCGAEQAQQPASGGGSVAEPVAVTYDGGIYVLDGKTLEIKADVKLAGFNRLNPAGDDKHLMVSTSSGFRMLDAAGGKLTDVEFPGAEPGHVVRHAGRTVLFTDGTGEVRILDKSSLASAEREVKTYKAPEPHHGVAIELANGELVSTLGNKDKRVGIQVLDANRKEITRNEDCPGVHGEATAKDEAVVIGCQNGVLIYRNGTITKVKSPTEYGRIGNQAGSDHSPIVLGDYKQDADAELERPTQVSLIDTTTSGLKLVDIGASYTFRSLARGPQGEALVLGTDGKIHVIDPVKAEVTRTIPVTDSWQEPLEWQQPRPAIFVRGGTVYVSDPNKQQLHRIDLTDGKITATASLSQKPNELSGVTA
ncbi:zinc metallochaperone AztD [Lentzea sp. NPDC051208]|uniref:zinc metallochaperone AztD n=1 Tax=Lentzea sp. NPDC051208 TaxID=3154642 RepID=UPI003421D351